jgi:hypothetical protein
MLINASSMFEFHMLVVAAIMFYILELIMEIVPNYPTFSVFIHPFDSGGNLEAGELS